MEKELRVAVERRQVEVVTGMLRDNPALDVNQADRFGFASLHLACMSGYDLMVAVLLTHKTIDVNVKDRNGLSPFEFAAVMGHTACVLLLLKDPRAKINEPNGGGYAPITQLVINGRAKELKWWIASGREMDLGRPGDECSDAIGVARDRRQTEIVTLLQRFKENPVEVRHEVRVELGCRDELAAEIFALVIFVSDGLLRTKGARRTPNPAASRFFAMTRQLPLDLQMVLCCRLVGSAKDVIGTTQREMGFRDLAGRI